MGSYCVIRQASLAGTISRVSNVGSIQGWAFEHVGQLLAMIQNPGGALTYGDLITSYRTRNQWDIAPQLPDGSFFSESNMQFQISGSPSLTCRANPCLLGIFVERGSTYNLTGAHGGSIDVMTVAAVGGSQTGGPPNGPGTGGDGGGTGMMRAGSADSYMFGGCGAGTFIGGSGNDIIVPGANCYGALAAQTIQFDIKTIGKTKQIGYATDYAGYVGRFRPGTDTLKIKSTIDAQNPPFSRPSDFTNHCSVIDGDTVCALPGNNVIVLKGVTSSLGSSVMIF